MLTKNEVSALKLSPTKKDFVQIWNELIEVAGKLSERWDPTSTNESDPGIVILKALTGIADKLNYNIDKNTLEAFMPTAAQEDSMRKLCEMLGYNIKYFRSAVTSVYVKYNNQDPSDEEASLMAAPGLKIPRFTNIINSDENINYFTLDAFNISAQSPSKKVRCMEGQLVKCEGTNGNNIITVNQINSNNRFYLPESQIAENGVFIYSVLGSADTHTEGEEWLPVDNLNVQKRKSKVYKFGFDSYTSRPYVEFPEDYSEMFNNGVFIYYARTSGLAGNISANTLTQIELPTTGDWESVDTDSFSVEQVTAANNGANIETIQQAYNNYKKTIGTFNTLVTCRDYMNKIYTMVDAEDKPYVSNILVTDIRNDINRAAIICCCDNAGIYYKETPLVKHITSDTTTEVVSGNPVQVAELSHEGTEPTVPYLVTEPVLLTEDESPTIEPIASTVNKPYFSSNYKTQSESQGTTIKSYWKLGDGNENGIALFYNVFLQLSDVDYQPDTFNHEADGEVIAVKASADADSGDVWAIKQGETVFKTILPVEYITPQTYQVEKYFNRVDVVGYQQTDSVYVTAGTETLEPEIDHFNLVFYPFKTYNQIKTGLADVQNVYDSSFKLVNSDELEEIVDVINTCDAKTIAHNIIKPRPAEKITSNGGAVEYIKQGDILSINNYLRLDATIATNTKITSYESAILIETIKTALANAFNMHELDFGEEIPFDSILSVIENADPIIKVVSLNEPALYTTYSVLDAIEDGIPKIKEYAVASRWLTQADAEAIGRFEIGVDSNNINGTFNTAEAKKIYNKLALRNVLAGRVPLFNYNSTFTSNFYESAYQTTTEVDPYNVADDELKATLSAEIAKLHENNTVAYITKNGALYTITWAPPATAGETAQITCTVTAPDTKYASIAISELSQNSSGSDASQASSIASNKITSISTECKINLGSLGDGVKLASGESVKFRAPNFTTVQVYPAYVNYRLELGSQATRTIATPAAVESLYNLLNADRLEWSKVSNYVPRWQKVLDFFGSSQRKKTFTLTQTISGFTAATATEDDLCDVSGSTHEKGSSGKCRHCGIELVPSVQKSEVIISVETSESVTGLTPEDYLAMSGCLKIAGGSQVRNTKSGASTAYVYRVKPELKYVSSSGKPNLDISIEIDNPFIVNSADISAIKQAVDDKIAELAQEGKLTNITKEWSLSITFEYAPFTAELLDVWEKLVKQQGSSIFGFVPDSDNNHVLWRVYENGGYTPGRCITADRDKLKEIEGNYITLLPTSRLTGVYIAKTLGTDPEYPKIPNDTDYELRGNDTLYIEYTPSNVTEDGTTETGQPVTVVHRAGTIIRPSGFEGGGLINSHDYEYEHTPHKEVTFQGESAPRGLFSLGANEQIEWRDFIKVVLNKDRLPATKAVYIYKNFNNCYELEQMAGEYTLKDGEYIFYTDANKSDMAYFGSGTKVTLGGRIRLPRSEIVDLSTILDNGLQIVPWTYVPFVGDADSITFEEFQYLTLGKDDILNNVSLLGNKSCLDGDWAYCTGAAYTLFGADEKENLPTIDVVSATTSGDDTHSGWEVCSTFDLDVSPDTAQKLRNNGIVTTSLTLNAPSVSNSANIEPLTACVADANQPDLYFKTNVSCTSNASTININDVYAKAAGVSGFELKFFAQDEPVIVQTAHNTVFPRANSTGWNEEPLTSTNSNDLWTTVSLDSMRVNDEDSGDTALRLPVSLIPNTYGVFSIYLNYTSTDTDEFKTWIEFLPTNSTEATADERNIITTMNQTAVWEQTTSMDRSDKLILKPGINCLRVNKSARLFIKASDKTTGTLSFDNLRLVDCEEIEYFDVDNKRTTQRTQGLNVRQLGYLSTNDIASAITPDMKTTLKEGKVEAFFDSISEVHDNASYKFTYTRNNLVKNAQQELKAIKSFADAAKTEIDSLLAKYGDDTGVDAYLNKAAGELISAYTALQKKVALLEAFENGFENDDTMAQIEVLRNSIADLDNKKQELLSDLVNLRDSTLTDTVNLSKEDIFRDFENANPSEDNYPGLLQKLINASRQFVETDYLNKLAELSEQVDSTIKSKDRTAIIDLLSGLQTEANAAAQNNIVWLLEQLLNDLDSSELTSLVELVQSHILVEEPDYGALEIALIKLREFLLNSERAILINKINEAVSTAEYDNLQTLVTALAEVLEAQSDNVEYIDTLLAYIANNTSDSNYASQVVTKVRTLVNNLSEERADKLIALVDSLDTALAELKPTLNDSAKNGSAVEGDGTNQEADEKPSFDDIIKDLNIARDSSVNSLLKQLDDAYTSHSDSVKLLEGDTLNLASFTASDSDVPFALDAVADVWFEYILADRNSFVYSQFTTVYNALLKLPTAEILSGTGSIQNTIALDYTDTSNRSMLCNITNIDEFKSLETKTNKLIKETNKNVRIRTRLSNVIKLMVESSVVNAGMEEFLTSTNPATATDEELALKRKIDEFKDGDGSIDVQTFLLDMKADLASMIDEDTRIYEATAALLSKTFLLPEQHFVDGKPVIEYFSDKLTEALDELLDNIRTYQPTAETSGILETCNDFLDGLLNTAGSLYDILASSDEYRLHQWLKEHNDDSIKALLISDVAIADISLLKDLTVEQTRIEDTMAYYLFKDVDSINAAGLESFFNISNSDITDTDDTYTVEAKKLIKALQAIETAGTVHSSFETAYNLLDAETQLLNDLLTFDTERQFYYTAPIDATLAIDFLENNEELNTLMNPRYNYDINNVNNSFVISKLDIGHLTDGIQVARSSRIS